MGTENNIQKFYTRFTKSVCQTVFWVFSLIGTKFSTNLVLCKRIFHEYITFLPSITDRVEEINRHMGSVNLLPIDISEETLEVDGMPLDPSKLDYNNPDKDKGKNDTSRRENALKSRRLV